MFDQVYIYTQKISLIKIVFEKYIQFLFIHASGLQGQRSRLPAPSSSQWCLYRMALVNLAGEWCEARYFEPGFLQTRHERWNSTSLEPLFSLGT